jgi:hypothetical protein
MKNLDRIRTLGVLFTLAAFAFVLAGPAPVGAQNRRPIPSPPLKPPTPENSGPPPNMRTADQATMEMQILMARRWTVADVEREQRRANAQLSADLERLSQLESENIAPVLSAKSIDYRTLTQATGEIKERASRIKFNFPIVLKDTGGKVKPEADPGKLGLMLPQLSRAIKSFIGNPVLRVNSPNDAELRATAGHDLEGIIKLSDTINKIAKRLSRTLVASR